MKEILNKILDNAKVAYKESVVIENSKIEDKLLSILSDTKHLLDMMENEPKTTISTKKEGNKMRTEAEEIERVQRRVPLWLDRAHQYNHKILVAYMRLSNNNQNPISVSLLEKHSGIDDPHKFYIHYNQMKTISEKNHAKVFEEENGTVRLWEPVAEFIVKQFTQKD